MRKIRKAIAAFLIPILSLPSIAAWVADTEPFDPSTLAAAISAGILSALGVYWVPNERRPE